jgi:RNA polymerase sigma-70 factor (ECF subfamily)
MPSADSINGQPFPSIADAARSGRSSEIEEEVIGFFEQFRTPLLRYTISFGIPVHDAEEVIQEVFLSLFRHLQLGRSRKNLRGWIFRVAHNLALRKTLYKSQITCHNGFRLGNCGGTA